MEQSSTGNWPVEADVRRGLFYCAAWQSSTADSVRWQPRGLYLAACFARELLQLLGSQTLHTEGSHPSQCSLQAMAKRAEIYATKILMQNVTS